jgi:hypothetical protein
MEIKMINLCQSDKHHLKILEPEFTGWTKKKKKIRAKEKEGVSLNCEI